MGMLADPNYKEFLTTIKQRIQQAQIKASIKVNQELLLLYWQIGKHIIEVQAKANRGDKVVAQLAIDLKESFP